MFEKSNFQYGFERYQLVANQTANLNPPGVDTIHLYGTDKDTPTSFLYSSDNNFDEEPESINGNGDDTVPIASLQSAGLLWKKEVQKENACQQKTINDQINLFYIGRE